MELIKKDVEDWIKPYSTVIGDRLNANEDLKKSNPFRYFLHLTIPNKFESYAIALHSF